MPRIDRTRAGQRPHRRAAGRALERRFVWLFSELLSRQYVCRAALVSRALTLRPQLEEDFARGDFSWLLNWLRENVHAHGRRYDLIELAQRVTGEPLSPKSLVRYLRERYGALYL
ncbi:MAG: hypothetical protein NVV63_06545 [Opitutus sp.]|nr:hypothetical protein [Opitutus sp.]